jgi:hypothetical protein
MQAIGRMGYGLKEKISTYLSMLLNLLLLPLLRLIIPAPKGFFLFNGCPRCHFVGFKTG